MLYCVFSAFEVFKCAEEAVKQASLRPDSVTGHPTSLKTQGKSEMGGTPSKKFADQDYHKLKKLSQSKGCCFRDPKFPVSQFGCGGDSIEYLRPHVSK